MRNLLLGLVFTGGLLCGTAHAAKNDIIELDLGVRYLFDSGYYKADNEDVKYNTDVFRFAGDHAFGFGLGVNMGHRFDSAKGPYDVLVKYNYTTAPEDGGEYTVSTNAGTVTLDVDSKLDQHDLILAVRLPGKFMPLPVLNSDILYYELGMGATTLTYTESLAGDDDEYEKTRTGLAFDVGMGCRIPLDETWDLRAGANFVFSKIQDVKNSSGDLIHEAPNAHGLRVQVGVVHYFESLF